MRLSEEDRLAWGDEQYDRWIDDGHIERNKTMNKYTKIVTFDVGTERPTEEYVRKLEAVVEAAKDALWATRSDIAIHQRLDDALAALDEK